MSYNPYELFVQKCECGNNFAPSGRNICPPCHRANKLNGFVERTKLRIARRKAKQVEREERKAARNKIKEEKRLRSSF